MKKRIDFDQIKKTSADQLLQELAAEEDDLDDIIEAELQRRALAHLRLMNIALLTVMSIAIAGLIVVVLFLFGILEWRSTNARRWSAWLPFWR